MHRWYVDPFRQVSAYAGEAAVAEGFELMPRLCGAQTGTTYACGRSRVKHQSEPRRHRVSDFLNHLDICARYDDPLPVFEFDFKDTRMRFRFECPQRGGKIGNCSQPSKVWLTDDAHR